MDIDRDTVLILTKEVTQCEDCKCDCHCKEELHTPADPLDRGGLCVCEDCQCKKA